MKKLALLLLITFFFSSSAYALSFKKKEEIVLFLSKKPPEVFLNDKIKTPENKFSLNSKIYYYIYNPNGFNSNYIKMQIAKQDDNAYLAGFTRIKNKTIRLKNKNFYCDYFLITEKGKYILQIFNIDNLQYEIAYQWFNVQDE